MAEQCSVREAATELNFVSHHFGFELNWKTRRSYENPASCTKESIQKKGCLLQLCRTPRLFLLQYNRRSRSAIAVLTELLAGRQTGQSLGQQTPGADRWYS